MSIRKLASVVGLVAFLWPAPASAHDEPLRTSVSLEVDEHLVTGSIEIPELSVVSGLQDTLTARLDVNEHGRHIRALLGEHFSLTGDDGTPWISEFGGLATTTRDGLDFVVAAVTVRPPRGTVSGFTLRYDTTFGFVDNKEVLVSAGPAGGERRLVGVLNQSETTIELDKQGRTSAGFWAMVHHGFDHVGDGADHLLFLLVLLLPAPLVAVAGRWQPGASGWRTLRQVVHVVTAFTLGHSVTLAASALDLIQVPSRPVEILIAISVGAGAVHAIRPLVGHREAAIAAGFGLVHGLAFAGILDELGLSNGTAAGALFGFNIGIELAQLAAVALVFPSLYALSRTRVYPVVRAAGAGVALVAACAWVADRANWIANPLQDIEEAAVDNPFAIAGSLAVVAVAAWVVERRVTPTTPAVA